MSRKSRQRKPKAAVGVGVGVGVGVETEPTAGPVGAATIETARAGVPFGVVVLVAAVMSIPTILQMTDETMSFDGGVTRLLIALAVAWLLSNLVYAVIDGMRPGVEQVDVELRTSVAPGADAAADQTQQYAAPMAGDEDVHAGGR